MVRFIKGKSKIMQKNVRILFVVIGVFVSILGCQSSGKKITSNSLVISEGRPDLFPDQLIQKQIQEDVAYLSYAFENIYIGNFYDNQERTKQFLNKIQNADFSKNAINFHNQIDNYLFELVDEHSVAVRKGKVGSLRSEYQRSFKSRQTYGSTRVSIRKIGALKVLLIRIDSFPNFKSSVWDGFLDKIQKEIDTSSVVILDVRSNDGGDDTIAVELVRMLNGGSFEHPISEQIRLESKNSLGLRLNSDINILNQFLKRKESAPEYLRTSIDEQRIYLNNSTEKNEFIRMTPKGERVLDSRRISSKKFAGDIFILTDKFCGSSCEFLVSSLEIFPKAQRVGENTQGCVHYSVPGLLVLPNSGIKVYVPTQVNRFKDGRYIERIGLVPQISTSSDSLEYVLSILNKRKK